MRQIDVRTAIQETAGFIRRTIADSGFASVVIGVSGGIDSAVAAALSVRALGARNVHAMHLPYGKSANSDRRDAHDLFNFLNLPGGNQHEIDIWEPVNAIGRALGIYPEQADLHKLRLGNVMARVRMIALFDFAKQNKCLVMGTENKSEQHLGYYTRHGDNASDIEPLVGFYKSEIWQLAKCLDLPPNLIKKAPAAGLWQGQTDEGELGFSYAEADAAIFYLEKIQAGKPREPRTEKNLAKPLAYIKKMEFKRRLPYLNLV